jgi:hypothetical protein
MSSVELRLAAISFYKNQTDMLVPSSSLRTSFKDSLPQELVTHVTAICGRNGEVWFDQLPEIIGQLESKWSLKVSDPFPGIEFNFVCPAVISDGQLAVVKVSPPLNPVEIHSRLNISERSAARVP